MTGDCSGIAAPGPAERFRYVPGILFFLFRNISIFDSGMWQFPHPRRTHRSSLRRMGLFACLTLVLLLGFLLGRNSREVTTTGQVYLNNSDPARPSPSASGSEGLGGRAPLARVVRPTAPVTPSPQPTTRASRGPRHPLTDPTDDAPRYLNGDGTGTTRVMTSLSTMEREVVRLTNAERRRAGCAPLRIDSRLVRSARAHSTEMATSGLFSHNSPDGASPWKRMEAVRYHDGGAENIGRGYFTAAETVRNWMANPGHRRNILDCRLAATGVGLAEGPDGPWWTQDFGYS
ncbi:hypothetical protein GCM10018953_00520 [Streptosporangium nondiastaticum]